MFNRPVILGFMPTALTASDAGAWQVTATVDDPLEINDGWAIARGDVVFLDLRVSSSAPGTVGRYIVGAIHSRSSKTVGVTLEWDAAGSPVSPAECLSVRGYLAQPENVAGTVSHPRKETILLEQEVIDLARQVEQLVIGTDEEDAELVRTLFADEPVAAGQFVKILPSGNVVVALPSDSARMPATGLALVGGTGMVRVRTGGITPRIASGLIPGAPVFVGDAGLPTTNPAGITLPAAVQLVGVALDTGSVALSITGLMTKRA